MQKSYLEVIEQLILDTNTKHPGLSEAERFNKVVRLEGLEYDSFLFNAFKRVEKELDKIDAIIAIVAANRLLLSECLLKLEGVVHESY